jgi:hypothetical protein
MEEKEFVALVDELAEQVKFPGLSSFSRSNRITDSSAKF